MLAYRRHRHLTRWPRRLAFALATAHLLVDTSVVPAKLPTQYRSLHVQRFV